MAMSAEHRSTVEASHRKWSPLAMKGLKLCLQIIKKFRSGTKKSKQSTNNRYLRPSNRERDRCHPIPATRGTSFNRSHSNPCLLGASSVKDTEEFF